MSSTRPTRRDRKRSTTMAATPLGMTLTPLGGVTDWFENLGDMGIDFKKAIVNLLADVLEAIVSNLLGFFSAVLKEFLFFPRPGTVSGLETVQNKAIFVFTGLLLIGWLAFFLNLQIFPYKTNSDPYRLLERSFAGIVMVIAGPMILDYAVVLTSAIGKYLYPTDVGDKVADIITANPGGSIIALVLLYVVGTTLIVIVAGFFVVLSIRMFLVYVTFALLPLFAAFWVFDTGVGKYTKNAADMFFKATAMILVAGILIAAILNVGVAVADSGASAFGGDTTDTTFDSTATSDFNESSTNSVETDDGEMCFKPLQVDDMCILTWNKLFTFIGIGGAMAVSSTVAMLGVGSLMGSGGMSSVVGGAVGGMAAGAVGKAKSKVGGGLGGSDGPGGEQADAGGPGPAEGGGGAPQAQLESPDDRGGVGSGTPQADLGNATDTTTGTGGTVSTPHSGGGSGRAQSQDQQQEDKSLLEKTAAAADTGSKIGGAVSAVDPTMGAATTAATVAAGAYKFHKEGGFSDVKQVTENTVNDLGDKAADVKSLIRSGSDESDDRGKLGDRTDGDQMDW